MKLVQWKGPGYRITSAEDTFFKTPMRQMTLFRFSTPSFEIEPHPGEFSMKLVLSGEERYIFDRRRVTLQPGQMLFVNAGESYASVIDRQTESFSVFFRRDEINDAADTLIRTAEDLLDTPSGFGNIPEVAQVAFSSSRDLLTQINNTILALDTRDIATIREEVRKQLLVALAEIWKISPPGTLAHVRRRATRDELVARVLRARSLIDDCAGQNLDGDKLAAEACLSRYHFLRVFSEVFGETPAACARRCRLEHAGRALEKNEDPRKVARSAGYRDFRSFVRAYRKIVPSAQITLKPYS